MHLSVLTCSVIAAVRSTIGMFAETFAASGRSPATGFACSRPASSESLGPPCCATPTGAASSGSTAPTLDQRTLRDHWRLLPALALTNNRAQERQLVE